MIKMYNHEEMRILWFLRGWHTLAHSLESWTLGNLLSEGTGTVEPRVGKLVSLGQGFMKEEHKPLN